MALSALQEVKKLYTTHNIAIKIQENIHSAILQGKTIALAWIPSHVGIEGNESVDKAAKEATEQDEITNINIPAEDLKSIIKKRIKEERNTSWHHIPTTNKLRQIKEDTSQWPPDSTRKLQTIITRLRIGHTKLTHAYLLNRLHPPVLALID